MWKEAVRSGKLFNWSNERQARSSVIMRENSGPVRSDTAEYPGLVQCSVQSLPVLPPRSAHYYPELIHAD